MMDNDIQFSWNAGYKAGVRDCQLIIADRIAENYLRNSNAKLAREVLEEVKNTIRLMLKSWEADNNA